MSEPDQSVNAQRERDIEAMNACVKHARDLLDSARAVMITGHPNIAFHLALLSLEELCRRKLIGLQGDERDPRLPEESVDLVFIATAYHEFSQPESMMAAIRRCLKPHGRVVIIEYAEENTDDPVAGLYTMSLPEIRSEIEAAGFQLQRVLDFLPMQHGLIFTSKTQNADGH